MKIKMIPDDSNFNAVALVNDAGNMCCLLTGHTIDEILFKLDLEIENRLLRIDNIENEFDRNFYRQGLRVFLEFKELLNRDC